MKRFGHLWEKVTAFENLLLAAKQAQKGKRFRDNVLTFNYNLESELICLQRELETQTYRPGAYKTFEIVEPKRRLISAAPYRDRVVHHALCNVIVPIFERTFIHDSYANRTGKGNHRALKQFVAFSRSSRYVLQCDICKYFPSIDRKILKVLLSRKIKCPDTQWLIDAIIDSSDPQETTDGRIRGLPIGNLTSQFFANVYLNGFDRFVKDQLKVKKYLRYVDDFALFSDDRSFLVNARHEMEAYLEALHLQIHPIKSQLFETKQGANFVGFRVLSDRIRVRNQNLRRGRRRLRLNLSACQQNKIRIEQVEHSLRSWFAHLAHGNTWHLRQCITAQL
ncbi:reverse transcriptase domain-containing protein [Tumidithrix elongata RA019]|uniref:Reverse transcriptase domain-containing protein n=1 Tax=Tumidithrix elongata BACA0141 TaxID=2716417 RepID=A0AAW9PZA9_9CYAN|nr:reverse transcriptase domain-containing protein [Tumidithrix elongata RA019]